MSYVHTKIFLWPTQIMLSGLYIRLKYLSIDFIEIDLRMGFIPHIMVD